MPYKSLSQAAYFHMHPEKVGGQKVVKEFDQASKGKQLPKYVKGSKFKKLKDKMRK